MSSRLTPLRRDQFIACLRKLGFEGPVMGTNHAMMLYGRKRLAIPSDREYSAALQRLMLREISEIFERDITRDEWIGLREGRKR